jgi:lipopolysaccharide transport system permease protein
MTDLPVTIYTPESPLREPAKLIRTLFSDLWASRGLAWRLFVRDTRSMYRQSAFGYLWAFAPPLVTSATFVFLSSQDIIDVGPTSVPYPAFVIIGTLLWQSFTDALNSPLKTTLAARSMLTKINFPREALILAGLAEVAFNCLIRAALFVPLFIYYGLSVPPTLPLAILGLGALILIGLSIGLLITPMGLLYGDVGRALMLVSTFWMLLTPVVYPTPTSGFAATIARWNPVSPVLQTTRDWITGQPAVHMGEALVVAGIAMVLLLVSWILFRLGMPILIERMGG